MGTEEEKGVKKVNTPHVHLMSRVFFHLQSGVRVLCFSTLEDSWFLSSDANNIVKTALVLFF